MLIELLFINPILFLMVATAILLALSIHEYFHAWTADFLGDPTARYQGRLTINPLVHLDPFGTLLLLFVGIGWGKPVPFNPFNLRSQKWGPALVALAGPTSNFLIALIFGSLLRFLELTNPSLIFFFSFFVWINLILGVFNLIPIPPLDGSHIFLTLFSFSGNVKAFLLRGGPFLIIVAILFMNFIGFPFICEPLFTLITGMFPPF